MTNPTCFHCHAQLDPGAKFCNDCGKPVAAVYVESTSPGVCPACGKPHAPAAHFCNACGRPLTKPGVDSSPSITSLPGSSAQTSDIVPARRKRLPWPAWAAIGAASLCLCAAVIAAAVTLLPPLLESTPESTPPVAVAGEPGRQPGYTPTPYTADPTAPPDTDIEPTVTELVASLTPTITEVPSPTPTPTSTPRPQGKPFVGELAPEFTLLDANTGEDITLSQFTGQPVVVTFWATWCTYCEDEMPFLQSAYEQHQTEGLVILAINYEEGRADVVEYGEDHDLTFPLLLDEDGYITDREYDVTGLPTSFFIYPDGTIAYVQIGSMTRDELNEQLDVIMSP
jgi:peroxiredoxin